MPNQVFFDGTHVLNFSGFSRTNDCASFFSERSIICRSSDNNGNMNDKISLLLQIKSIDDEKLFFQEIIKYVYITNLIIRKTKSAKKYPSNLKKILQNHYEKRGQKKPL